MIHTIPTTLTQLRTRLQDQHKVLNNLNADLITQISRYAEADDVWEENFDQKKTVKETVDYLKMIRTETLTVANFQLIAIATNQNCLQELDTALQAEIIFQQQLFEILQHKMKVTRNNQA